MSSTPLPGVSAENSKNYIGQELDLFEAATAWKAYYSSVIVPYFQDPVLEVGAGQGGTTVALAPLCSYRWECLEPDSSLAAAISRKIASGDLPERCAVRVGTLADSTESELFSSILYIDVLEHIREDREELRRAASRLRPGGNLIVLSPAYQFLYSPFDQAIGHYRRYTQSSLSALRPEGCKLVRSLYLDSVGVLLSLANRLLLRQGTPTKQQIAFWNRRIIPLSRLIDPLVAYQFGRSVICIWQKM